MGAILALAFASPRATGLHLHPFVFAMVTSSRLEWDIAQLTCGRQSRLKLNSHADKLVLHIELLSAYDIAMLNGTAIFLLQYVLANLPATIAVDHGHSSSGG